MAKYAVYHAGRFDKELSKFDADFQSHVDKIEEQLKENPFLGKPLDAKWFREKKHGKYRIYFVIYEEFASVFMVAISEKKDQQKVINTVRLIFDILKEELKKMVDKEKLT
ncbi:MAG: hypothetical protein PHP62_05745 [Candidatus Moranbacteria bacterium]|nr:hypothetical protein [Candidatus Moranbacteria bacterium]